MKPKQNSGILYVGNGNSKTQLNPQGELPKLLKDIPMPNQQTIFTRSDAIKVIDQIMKKGNKFLQLKRELDKEDVLALEKKVSKSDFLHFAVRKEMNLMGDQRRLGTGLRGFSRLILEEFQQKCWPMIQLQAELMLKEAEEEEQRQKVLYLFDQFPQKCDL